jgi:hypothetical protein
LDGYEDSLTPEMFWKSLFPAIVRFVIVPPYRSEVVPRLATVLPWTLKLSAPPK